MKFSAKSAVRIAIMSVFFVCMVFANFYALRKMSRVAVELYLYDKLLVAYNFGGKKALFKELNYVLSDDKYPHELTLARDLEVRINNLADPGLFLKNQILQNKNKIEFIRNLRTIAIILMFLIFLWQLIVKLLERLRPDVGRSVAGKKIG